MKIKQLKGILVLKTGLHIGAGDTGMHIGGIDSEVVKHPKTLHPYIPGSSVKGKVRSLLELYFGLINFTGGRVFQSNHLADIKDDALYKKAETLLKLFGNGAGNSDSDKQKQIQEQIGITRLSFRDSFISENREDKILSEVKSENTIDRKTSKAENLRFFERVPAGIEFAFEIAIKELDGDNFEEMLGMLKQGLKLLESDALGGSGSRGYGRVEFKELKIDDGETIDLSKIVL